MQEINSEKPVIHVENLYRIYKSGQEKVYALNGVSFDIMKGEFVAIVGTSGSGKSTLLNMMAGLEKPSKGKIVIAGYFIAVIATAMLAIIPANLVYVYVIVYSSIPRSIGPLTNASAADIAELPLDIPIVNFVREELAR